MSEKQFNDPYASREQEKYDNPVPSRETILELIAQQQSAMNREQIQHHFQIDDDERQEGMRRRLKAMERDNQLVWVKGYYHHVDDFPLITGIVSAHRDGYGFVFAEDSDDDIFLNQREMQQLFHGDRVNVRIINQDKKGRRGGVVAEIIQRNTHKITGISRRTGERWLIKPEHKYIREEIFIEKEENTPGLEEGQVVVLEITQYPSRFRKAEGKVVQILGDHMYPGQEIDVALRIHQIPFEWQQDVLQQVEQFSQQLNAEDLHAREDCRELPFVTIDGEDAKDFDDALYAYQTESGWNLKVAIADVSHYVEQQSALDQQAQLRGTSVYFPGRVIPMLPEALSNGLCSLMPKQDRLVMLCDIQLDDQGKVQSYAFKQAVICSKARLTYRQVAETIFDDEQTGDTSIPKELVEHLLSLKNVYELLAEQRHQKGYIDFITEETRIVFCDNKKISYIEPVQRNQAHRLVEECMLLANVCAADYLLQNELPGLYRNHFGPSDEKLLALRKILASMGLKLSGGDEPNALNYAELLDSVKERIDVEMIHTHLLRSMSQAYYSVENEGHFGLAFEHYAHFTSPIRRYPDLLVHRAIKASLNKLSIQIPALAELGENCSAAERRADEAVRDVTDWLKCEYMMDKVGENFDGVVSTVTNFGLFVKIPNIFVEGLLHVTNLPHDYYVYDDERQMLVGERSKKCYKIGDKLKIRVASVNLDERKIDFLIASNSFENQDNRVVVSENNRKIALFEVEQTNNDKDKKKSRRRGRKMSFNRRM